MYSKIQHMHSKSLNRKKSSKPLCWLIRRSYPTPDRSDTISILQFDNNWYHHRPSHRRKICNSFHGDYGREIFPSLNFQIESCQKIIAFRMNPHLIELPLFYWKSTQQIYNNWIKINKPITIFGIPKSKSTLHKINPLVRPIIKTHTTAIIIELIIKSTLRRV